MSLRIGTCSFTAEGWEKSFYPPGVKKADYLSYYAAHFNTLEVDSTFYRVPAHSTVRKWHDQTPPGFRFACKATQAVTHEKCLLDCDSDLEACTAALANLGDKLGAVLLQFPYFNKKAFKTGDDFLDRLEKFLPKLSAEIPWALEVRNQAWLGERLFALLRRHNVAFALIDHPWMPRPQELLEAHDPLTAKFAYIRLLGDRNKIEEKTKVWDQVVHDCTAQVSDWVEACRRIQHRGVEMLVYVNNHFEGHAPATVRKFAAAWGEPLAAPPARTVAAAAAPLQASLLDAQK